MTTKVILMRHGETSWNSTGRWQGHAPTPLNEAGIVQAQQAATHLYQHEAINAIYSSDLLRAHQTAAFVAQLYQLPIKLDARLREIDLGAWQGLTRQEIMEWDTERYQALWQQHHLPRPGGESLQQVGQRTAAAVMAWADAHPHQTILGVTHSGTIRGLLYQLGLSEEGSNLNIGNASLTTFVFDGTWQLIGFGEVTFLSEGQDCEE